MRVLVTGGAGYIGSVTVRSLLDAGHECVVLDTLERGWRSAVDRRAQLVVGCVGDRELLHAVLPGCDAVMHLAGLIEVAESQRDPELYFRVNAEQPLGLLESMLSCGVTSLVFSSTAAVYGEPTQIPIAEDHPLQPINAYGESKLRFEQAIEAFAVRGLKAIRYRYFNVAGAWPDGTLGEAHDPETHIVPRVLGAIAGGKTRFEVFGGDYPTADGTCVRDYIHVCDLAEAHRMGLERLVSGGEGGVFNLGNGEGYSNLEVIRTCAQVAGADIDIVVGPRRAGDPAVLVASGERARDMLGWRPSRPALDGMIADAWRWHLARPNGYR